MKEFFLLNSEKAKLLYSYVRELPIVDYHNHLSVQEIKENKRYIDIYEVWVKPDPYKHRAMRMCGVEEEYITGSASNKEKFTKWCETLPKLIGNPLHHWSMMELDMIFHIPDSPNANNAADIYERCNRYLAENIVDVSSILKQFSVCYLCPCASLADDLTLFSGNEAIAPSLRGDDVVNLSSDFINKLQTVTGHKIKDLSTFKTAVWTRIQAFYQAGCRFADHALDDGFVFYPDDGKNAERFDAVCKGNIPLEDSKRLASHLLVFLGECYSKIGFVMQLHIGAKRYTSSKLRAQVGPNGCFAGIGNNIKVKSITEFLDCVDNCQYGLPKTMLFTINPADNAIVAVLSGSYAKKGVSGLITQGPAWWWCDHKQGLVEMLEHITSYSILSNFMGMTTDSRSFLSFVRHDYFRRILCSWVAEKAECGDFPDDMEELKALVHKLCYQNAKDCFGGN